MLPLTSAITIRKPLHSLTRRKVQREESAREMTLEALLVNQGRCREFSCAAIGNINIVSSFKKLSLIITRSIDTFQRHPRRTPKCHSSLHQWYPCYFFLSLQSQKFLLRAVARPGNGYACHFQNTLISPNLTSWLWGSVIQFSRPKCLYGCSVHAVNMRLGL